MAEKKEEEKAPKKVRNQALSKEQEQFCLNVSKGMEPLEAMLQAYPNRRTYEQFNQNRLLKELQNNPRVIKRLKVLFEEIRNNEILGDMYDFDKGVRILLEEIRLAKEKIQDNGITESMHRVIFTSIQELNRMYGFNIFDREGNQQGAMNVTFVNVDRSKVTTVVAKGAKK